MTTHMKQYEVLKWASLFLKKYDREEAVAPLLLQHYLDVSRTIFFTRMQEPVPDDVVHQFQAAIRQHAKTGIPVAHLIGAAPFYGRAFSVNRDVLIPRPETEELVAGVLDYVYDWRKTPIIADIGTGSGIIAITLALEAAHAHVYATDISSEAMNVAQKNASLLGADVTFLQGDLVNPIAEHAIQPDIIVSNPPYIREGERVDLDDTVREFDPEIALFAGDDGLEIYKRLFHQLKQAHIPPSLVAVEIGHAQGEAVSQIAKNAFLECHVQIRKDINGNDRMVFVECAC